MTVVNVTAALTALGGSEPVTSGRITVEYLRGANGEPATRAVGAAVTLPAPIVIAIVDGSPAEPVDVPPTDGTCYARIWVECRVPRDAGFLELPAVAIPATGPVDITALVAVDPASFEPVTTVVTAWQLAVDQVAAMQTDVTAKSAQAIEAAADAGTFAGATEFDANRAGQSAFQAGQSAASALGHKNAAAGSADASAGSATSAAGSVVAASTERQGAADERLGARQERLDAQTARTGAETAQSGAQTARAGAETARTGSETAKTAAEAARDAAQAATFAGTTPAAGTSLDTLTTPGMYRITYGATVAQGAPFENFYGSLRVEIRAGGAVTQVARKHNALSADSRRFYQRTQTGGGWGGWAVFSSLRVNNPGGQPGAEFFMWDDTIAGDRRIPTYVDLGTADLNTITIPGVYGNAQSGSALNGKNYPALLAGVLEVLPVNGAAPSANPPLIQRYTAHSGGAGPVEGFYQRRFNGGVFTAWNFISKLRFDETAGRAAYGWDYLNGREQRLYGDTGWRDISALKNANWAGTFLLRRQGDRITILLNNVTRQTGETTQKLLGSLPVGYQGTEIFGPQRFMVHTPSSPVTAYRGYFTDSGTSMFFDAPIGAGLYGSFDYITSDPWPTAPIGAFLTAPSVQ